MRENPRPFSSPYPADGVAFGRYRDLETIAEGGMGKVFKAFDPQLNIELALKVLPRGLDVSAEQVKRFRREVQLLASLNHPGIVRVYDSGETDGWQYFSMELIRGLTLLDHINEHMPPPETRLKFVSDLAEVLAFLHERDIVHRDLKPSNVMITGDGKLKLTDFGIAKSMGEAALYTEITTFDARPGTPYYMSPDRTNELRDTSTAKKADVYSMAVLAYEIIACRLPYDVENLTATECLVVVREEPPTSLTDRGIAIDPMVEDVIMSGLHKDHSKRPGAAEFARDLRAALGVAPEPPRKKRSLLPLALAASVALALLAGLHIHLVKKREREFAALQQPAPKPQKKIINRDGAAGTNAGRDSQGATIAPEQADGIGRVTVGEIKKPGTTTAAATQPEAEKPKPGLGGAGPLEPPKPEITKIDPPKVDGPLTPPAKKPEKPNPEDVYLQNVAAGERHLRLGEWTKARAAFERALEVPGYEKDATAQNGLRTTMVKLKLIDADAAARKKDWPKAIEDAQQALTIKSRQNEEAAKSTPVLRIVVKAAGKPLPTAAVCVNGSPIADGSREIKVKAGHTYRIKVSAPRTANELYVTYEAEYTARKAVRQELDVTLTRIGPVDSPDLAMKLIPIAPGTFTMGSNRGGLAERPAHKVTISRMFWMGQSEVTQDQYFTIMRKNPSNSKGAELPVERVTWVQTVEFCKRLTERERAAGRLPKGYIYRLPTEAEWEYCCRAGSSADYHFGSDVREIGKYAWVSTNSGRITHEVARKRANAWGLYDMHGNVFEWVWDRYNRYSQAPVIDPTGGRTSRSRIVRGGSWSRSPSSAKAYERVDASPNRAYSYVGFRVVLARPID